MDERQEEVEVLMSIFPSEMEILSPENPIRFKIRLQPNVDGEIHGILNRLIELHVVSKLFPINSLSLVEHQFLCEWQT
jgi:hypothetical protein